MFDTEEEALERLNELQESYKKKIKDKEEICLAQHYLMSGVRVSAFFEI